MAISRVSQVSVQAGFPKSNTLWDGVSAVGGMEAISFVVVPSGGLSVVEFNNIPQTYAHLQIRALARGNRTPVTYDNFNIRFNSDTGSNYSYHTEYGDGRAGGPFVEGAASGSSIPAANITGSASLANSFGVAIIDILDYAKTNKNTTLRSLNGYESNTTGYSSIYSSISYISGAWYNTAAVTSITILPANSPLQEYSHFALYGVK